MATFDLDSIKVARPCKADWDRMEGDDQVRFCGDCRKNVYDLSALDADGARALLEKHEGKICVRFWRRRDGKVLTSDCPVGVRAARVRTAGLAAGIAAAAGLAGGLWTGLRGRGLPVFDPEEHHEVMGKVAAPQRGPDPSETPPLVVDPDPDPEPQEIKGEVHVPPETPGEGSTSPGSGSPPR